MNLLKGQLNLFKGQLKYVPMWIGQQGGGNSETRFAMIGRFLEACLSLSAA